MEKLLIFFCISVSGLILGVSSQIINITVAAQPNRQAVLPCRLPGGSAGDVNVRWFNERDGWLTSGTTVYKYRGQISIDKPGLDEWNMIIKRVSLSFEGTYSCKTDRGVLLAEVKLVIETSPKIDESESSHIRVTFVETSEAILRCVVTGTPEPVITWYRREREIGVNGSQLIIPNISRYAADEYKCLAKNKIGEAERRMIVKVDFAPEVTVMEPEVYAAGGEAVVMSCVVQGSPLLGAYWKFENGKPIKANWKYLLLEEEGENGMPVRFLTLGIRKSILSSKDYGTYKCVAEGDNLVAEGTVELKKRQVVNTDETGEKVIKYD